MPRVPIYDQQQVRQAPLPDVRVPNMVPDNAGILGQASREFAQTRRVIAAHQEKEQEEADVFRVEAEINKLRDLETDLTTGTKGYQRLTGEQAFNLGAPLASVYQQRWDDGVKDIESGLANDNQRRKFQILAGRLKSQFNRNLGSHEEAQSKAVRESTFKGVVAAESEAVARAMDDPNPESRTAQIGTSLGRVTANANRYYSKELGLSPEQTAAEVLKLQSSMHKTVIDRYLERNDPQTAKAYFEANKDRINAADGAKARQQIEKDGRDFLVNQAADQIWQKMGPKSDTDAVNLDLMEREANKTFEKDADGRKLLISELRQRQAAHDYSAKERQNAVEGGIWKQVLDGKPLAQIRRSPEFRGLDGKNQAAMIEHIERYQKRNENDPASVLAKFAQYWSIASDPDTLRSTSDAAIFAMAPVMGPELVKAALNKKQELAKSDEKVIEAKIDSDSFNYWATQAGLDTTPPKDSEKAKDLGALKYRVETMIDAEQKKRGKQLTRDEKDTILKKLLTEVPVRQNTSFMGIPTGQTVAPKRLYQLQYPENIQIPAAERQQIVDGLKRAGIANPTDAQIREGYVRLRMK